MGGRIRGLLRYRDLTDVQILKHGFSLGEAQEIIAWLATIRTAGYLSSRLKPSVA